MIHLQCAKYLQLILETKDYHPLQKKIFKVNNALNSIYSSYILFIFFRQIRFIKIIKLKYINLYKILELINLFDQIRTSSILQNSHDRSPTLSSTTTSRVRVQQSIDDPLADILIKLTGQLDGMDMEFEKILEKNC